MGPHFRRQPPRQGDGAESGGGPTPVLDADTLARLRQLDPDGQRGFVAQVLRTFDTTLDRHLSGLAEAAARRDAAEAGRIAHTLKSSSAAIGALVFSRCCFEVEQLAKQDDPATLGAPLAALLAEGERVRLAVRDILAA
jgi:HPt (histidine-containing phosphotransfer) domain-containing protein